jgi:hypothetical protein
MIMSSDVVAEEHPPISQVLEPIADGEKLSQNPAGKILS